MKKIQFVLSLLVFFIICHITSFAQIMNIQKFIGKSQNDLINQIGKPVSIDDSNQYMITMSYNLLSLVCVADQNGIYKAEIKKVYTSENEALDEINQLIYNSVADGCVKDSISEYKYTLYKPGVKTEIDLTQIKDSPNLKLIIKATKQE